MPALPCRGGAELARRLFEPLGWAVEAEPVPLDPTSRAGATPRTSALRLTGTVRLADALNHLYVLLPVLDDAKHYWVGADEVDKLIRAGAGWLAGHPERELITPATCAAAAADPGGAGPAGRADDVEPELDRRRRRRPVVADDRTPVPLAVQRRDAVLAALRAIGARRVGDLGCGEGALLARPAGGPVLRQIVGGRRVGPALQTAARRLRLETMAERRRGPG